MPLFFLSFLHHHFLQRTLPINLALTLCLAFTLTLISHSSFAIPSNQNTVDQKNVHKDINDIQLKFSKFSANEGLTSNNIFDISQDAQGYLWIATEEGLNRFDGEKIESYRHNINDTFSISDNLIRKVFIDNNNTLWVGTRNGLSRYNRELDNFDNFHHDKNDKSSLKDNIIWDIYQDNNENLWVSTSLGVQKISIAKGLTVNKLPNHSVQPKKLIFNTVTFDGFNKELTEVKTIYQDSQDNYWFGSYDTGIHLVNKNFFYNGSLLTDNKYNLSIDANSLFDIKEIDGKIWLATDNGIYIIDHHYQLVSHISATKKTSHNSYSKDMSTMLLSDHIRAIEKYDDNHIWVATQKGLNIISLTDGSISSHQKNAYSTSLSDNWIMDIFRDKNGTMWLGCYGGGVNKYSPLNDKLYHGLSQRETSKSNSYRVESFTQASDGKVYLSTEQQGIFSVDKSKNVSKPFIAPVGVRQVLSDNLNNLWLVTRRRELFQYNLLSQTLLQHEAWLENANYETSKQVKIIDNNLWYISQSGLLTTYDTVKQSFNYYPNTAIAVFSKLQKDQGSTLWLISDDNKLVSFDTHTLTFAPKTIKLAGTLHSKQISSIAIDNQNIWLGTYSRGITLIDSITGISNIFNENNGLPNNSIASILIDDDSNAWIASNKGISVITAQSKKILHFDTDVLTYNPEFITRSNLKTNSGELYLGNTRGFYTFFQKELLNIKQSINQPLFTNLYLANKKITIKQKPLALQTPDYQTQDSPIQENYTLSKQLNSLKEVILEHDHPAVSFGFVSPNTKLPQQLSYRYRLIGLENEWIDADKSNLKATYTNLAPGHYTLEVQTYDLQSFEESTVNQLKVQILPPWWLSTGAIFIYLLISLLLLSFVFQQLRNRRLYHLQIKENEERLKLSLWGSGDEMWDWNMLTGKVFRSNIWGKLEFPQDGSRNVLSPNSLSPDILPPDESDISEIPKKGNIHQHDIAKVKYALEQHTLGFSDHYEAAYRVQDKDNDWIWVLDRGKIVGRDENEKPIRMTGTLKDISQIKNTEERLRLFAKCIENISDAIVIYDKEFITVDVNKAFVKITGETKKLVLGQPLEFKQYPIEFCHNIKQHLITKGRWHGEIESLHPNKEKYFTDLNIDVIHDENDNVSHFVSVFSDITKRKATEKELRRLASSDTLTGLPNRAFFQVQQAKLVKKKTPHALLVFDLDNFKKINDSLGHQVGDDILCKIAKRILPIARKQDSVYRLGGDEFSILIENTNDINTITTISNEVLKKVAMPFKLKSQEIVLFSSIGIVLYPDDGITPHELLKNADTAMYQAKNAGGNRYQFFNESMNKAAVHRLQVETLIRHGLRENSFSVFYQPKISIASGQISGMEALVRFITPANGFVSPAVFIPVSEETGQIIDIGEIVLRKACFATKKWVDEGLFKGRVAVNLSAVQFTQANLVDLIANTLTESGLAAKYLELEITEGTVMDAPQKAIETMEQIRAMGVHLSLDDFGTGYSSLSYLKKFPLNTLKIDKAFIDDIEISEQGRNMVATIVTIAHNLEMQVVAEGVETQPQLDFLTTLNCDQLQGYLYSKPLPTSNFHQYLISHKVTNQSTSLSQSY